MVLLRRAETLRPYLPSRAEAACVWRIALEAPSGSFSGTSSDGNIAVTFSIALKLSRLFPRVVALVAVLPQPRLCRVVSFRSHPTGLWAEAAPHACGFAAILPRLVWVVAALPRGPRF